MTTKDDFKKVDFIFIVNRYLSWQSSPPQANNNNKGFEVKGAPWQGASDDAFPTLGGGGGAATATPVWGPRR